MDTETATDPEAPYGRKLDGSPKRAPGGRPPTGRRGRAGARAKGPAAPPRRPANGRTRTDRGPDYRPGVIGFLSIPALGLRLAGLPLDAASIMLSAPEIAEAVNTTAKDRPEIAAMCDRLIQAGPYGLIITALLRPVAQIGENHGWIPTGIATRFGAVPRAQLAAYLAAEEAAARAEAEQPPAEAPPPPPVDLDQETAPFGYDTNGAPHTAETHVMASVVG